MMMGCVEYTPRDCFGPPLSSVMDNKHLDSSPSFLPDSLPSAKSKRFKKKNSLFPVPNLQSTAASPTTSLAADLSQNFFIDQTPKVPTPRRSLFSFKPSYNLGVSPSSSGDATDVDSPLPHKTRPTQNRVLSDVSIIRHKNTFSNASSLMYGDNRLAPPERPAKFRRTQSMYQHPEDVVMENAGTTNELEGDSPVAASTELGFKSFTVKEDSFPRIERDTLCELLDGQYDHIYDQTILIDCRFEYEYKGGHVDGALNINSKDDLEEKMLELANSSGTKTLLVFHCEYSAHRGPRMAQHLRNFDRHCNAHRYPELYYPDIVILQGGYKHFFDRFYDRCVPQRYVEMNDSSHKHTCEREMNKFRRSMRVIGARSQSYTIGSCSPVNFRFPKKREEELVGQRLFV